MIQPNVKTTLQATHAQRTLKSKNISNLNKSTFVAAISSKNKEEAVASSLSENTALVVPHEATRGQLQSDGNGYPSTASDIIAKRKSNRRRSFTSLLMARSKVEAYCIIF